LIKDWREVLPASSLCLVVPIVSPQHHGHEDAREQEAAAARRLEKEEIDLGHPGTGGTS
jgi:hypothetical protein